MLVPVVIESVGPARIAAVFKFTDSRAQVTPWLVLASANAMTTSPLSSAVALKNPVSVYPGKAVAGIGIVTLLVPLALVCPVISTA